MNQTLQNISTLLEDKKTGIVLKSKARWVEDGEKPTKYFCTLESRNYTNKTIQNIELTDGSMTYEQTIF